MSGTRKFDDRVRIIMRRSMARGKAFLGGGDVRKGQPMGPVILCGVLASLAAVGLATGSASGQPASAARAVKVEIRKVGGERAVLREVARRAESLAGRASRVAHESASFDRASWASLSCWRMGMCWGHFSSHSPHSVQASGLLPLSQSIPSWA